jgi:hypothetical protein
MSRLGFAKWRQSIMARSQSTRTRHSRNCGAPSQTGGSVIWVRIDVAACARGRRFGTSS